MFETIIYCQHFPLLYSCCYPRLCSDKWGENSYKCSSLLPLERFTFTQFLLGIVFSQAKQSRHTHAPMHQHLNVILPVMMHFQVPGIAWKPSQFKPAEEQTSSQRGWSGINQSANEESRGCRCCANNEESQRCRRTTLIVNTCQELVFCQIPWCLSWPLLL